MTESVFAYSTAQNVSFLSPLTSQGISETDRKNKSKIETVCHEDNAKHAANKFRRAVISRWEVFEVTPDRRDVSNIVSGNFLNLRHGSRFRISRASHGQCRQRKSLAETSIGECWKVLEISIRLFYCHLSELMLREGRAI
jgi:hypothetical protein